VALYDLGEWTRFYPNGRGVAKSLGGKDQAMELIGHRDPTIQMHALQCISKVMVTNWEFMK
jgi:V-type H+-transporting ATPase subunit H